MGELNGGETSFQILQFSLRLRLVFFFMTTETFGD